MIHNQNLALKALANAIIECEPYLLDGSLVLDYFREGKIENVGIRMSFLTDGKFNKILKDELEKLETI